MSQLQLMDPQFECGIFEIWSVGIIDSLIYRANCGLDDLPYDVDLTLTLDQRLEKCESSLDLLNLRTMKPELYEILLAKTGYLVRKNCSHICDPCDKLTFKTRFIDLVFLNVLREKQLLTEPTEYYYESVVDIFSKVTFGLAFIIDLMADQGWYKFQSKFLRKFTDDNQVKLIKKELRTLSSDFHLNVLFVIWNIENVINSVDDLQALNEFKDSADHLLNQSSIKTFDFKDNLSIYLALINVTLEEFMVTVSRQAARMLDLHKKHETEELVNPIFTKVKVNLPFIEDVVSFIDELGEKLFPNQQIDDIEIIKSCLKDPKSESIIGMIASIKEIYSFLSILQDEISFPELKFEGFDTLMAGWSEWSPAGNFNEMQCQEVLLMKRFFVQEHEESRYLTCIILKYGLPKYLDILETIDLEFYLDPFIIFYFCDVLQATYQRCDYRKGDRTLIEELTIILKRVFNVIKSKKRIASIFKARANFFGLHSLLDVEKAKLTPILRSKSGALRYDHIRTEIFVGAFLSPYEILNFIVGDTLEHSHHMIPFLSKLFCTELNSLMSFPCETKYQSTLFEAIIGDRLTILPTDTTTSGFLKLIKETFLLHVNTKKPFDRVVLSIERLIRHLLWDSCLDPRTIAVAKASIYKLIQNLTDEYDIPWPEVEKEPGSLLYSLITMIDYYYLNGQSKEQYVSLIAFVMNKKVRRKITSRELTWIINRFKWLGESVFLVAYLQPWLEERLSFYLDIKTYNLSETILTAAILKDNVWILHATHHVLDGDTNPHFHNGISAIFRFLVPREYDNLFRFLCCLDGIDGAILDMCEGFHIMEPKYATDLGYMSQCMVDCLYHHYLDYYKNPEKYDPVLKIKPPVRTEEKFLPLFYRRVSSCLFLSAPVEVRRANKFEAFLEKLAIEMAQKGIDVRRELYNEDRSYHYMAERILKMYHKGCYYEPPVPKIRLIPAGARC